VRTFHTDFPIWIKIVIMRLHIMLLNIRVSWKPAQGRQYFSKGTKVTLARVPRNRTTFWN